MNTYPVYPVLSLLRESYSVLCESPLFLSTHSCDTILLNCGIKALLAQQQQAQQQAQQQVQLQQHYINSGMPSAQLVPQHVIFCNHCDCWGLNQIIQKNLHRSLLLSID